VLTAEHHTALISSFHDLVHATHSLCCAIQQENQLISWTQNTDKDGGRAQACSVYSQLHYTDNQAPREILICPGFIGASLSTINLARELNECKERFKKKIIACKNNAQQQKIMRSEAISALLQSAGLGRLHLKQCYRKIPILSTAPKKITWTWAHTRSIKKITVAKARTLLLQKGEDIGIQLQLQQLNYLNEHEPLAIVQELAPHLRANIVYPANAIIHRQMIKGPIPILFLCTIETPYPDFSPPSEKQPKNKNRSIRCDVKLDPNVYLPALRAHRYIA
jgi:hypothetical protein